MAGEYRAPEVLAKIDPDLARDIRAGSLRLAKANQPITGAVVRHDLAEPMAVEYEAIGMDRYARELRDGTCVPITIGRSADKYWAPGELFFTS